MQVMTRSGGLIDVAWPPKEDPQSWCLGASADGRYLVAYRAGPRGWQAVEWEALGARATAGRRKRH